MKFKVFRAALMMEAVRTSETSVNFNLITLRYTPEDSKPHTSVPLLTVPVEPAVAILQHFREAPDDFKAGPKCVTLIHIMLCNNKYDVKTVLLCMYILYIYIFIYLFIYL
jgi:hypothetical protein